MNGMIDSKVLGCICYYCTNILHKVVVRTSNEKAEQRRASQGDVSILMKDLNAICTLGTGTFGRVKLVEHTTTGRTMALKAMMKTQIIVQNLLD